MWRRTRLLLGHVVGETEGKGPITITYVCNPASWSQRATSCGGVRQSRGKEERRNRMVCGACGQPYHGRKPNRSLTQQLGDTAHEQVVIPSNGAPDGECANTCHEPDERKI